MVPHGRYIGQHQGKKKKKKKTPSLITLWSINKSYNWVCGLLKHLANATHLSSTSPPPHLSDHNLATPAVYKNLPRSNQRTMEEIKNCDIVKLTSSNFLLEVSEIAGTKKQHNNFEIEHPMAIKLRIRLQGIQGKNVLFQTNSYIGLNC